MAFLQGGQSSRGRARALDRELKGKGIRLPGRLVPWDSQWEGISQMGRQSSTRKAELKWKGIPQRWGSREG